MMQGRGFMNFLVRNWVILSYIILLVISFALFTFMQAVPAFADPDSFYHVKSALLIPEQGFIKEFPWLQFTVLKDNYIDQHFLYHVFLIPFTQVMDPIQGAKLANIIITTGLVMLFYWFLRSFKIKYAFWYVIVLLITMPFIFRINLVKAPAFSIIFLIVGLYLILKHKTKSLFIFSFLYVWAYGGFILILVFSGIYAAVSIMENWLKHSARKFWHIVGHSRELRLFFSSLGGVLAGIIINPYFPENLNFYWHQLIKIGIINYQSVIPVGNEWYPYKFIDLSANTAFVSILMIITFYLFIVNFKKPNRKTITLFVIFLFFFIFTLKSRRYVEYYVPFAVLFVALALNQQIPFFNLKKLWSKTVSFCLKRKVIAVILIVYFCVTLPVIIIKDVRHTYNDFQGGIRLDRFAEVSSWLEKNSQPGDIIFHSSWDEFPMLFYFNDKNYYIIGLDPTFMYEYDQELYKKMVNITLGDQKTGLYEDIKNEFQASYVLVENNHHGMMSNIKKDEGFKEVYSDKDATIYQVL